MRKSWNLVPRIGWILTAMFTIGPLAAQVDVLTHHNDNARSGANLKETQLNTSNVNNDHFGKLAFRIVDGNVYAQPLVVSQANIQGRAGATNAVIIATEHNSVFAFDAEDTNQASTTAQLWHTGPEVLGEHIESVELYARIGSPACVDLTTEIGITGTPVIKLTKQDAPKEGVIFVVAKSKAANKFLYKLFALSLADGHKLGELVIQGDVPGSGIGSTGSGAQKKITFDPLFELNRPALLLNGNTLYVAFGGHCDQGPYHGWVFAYDVSNPAALKKVGTFCSTPNGKGAKDEGRAGIWMSGEGPAADDAGNVYFATGDGTANVTTDFGDSVVKINLSPGGIQVADWYTPQNQETLKRQDADLGSAGAVLLPNSHLLLAGGKEGRMYLIDRDHMGKGVTPSLHSFQVTHNLELQQTLYYNLHATPVIWPRAGEVFVYVNGEENPVKQYRLIPDTAPGGAGWKFESDTPFRNSIDCPARPNCISAPYPNFPNGEFGRQGREAIWMPGGFPSLSANGTVDGSGILWITMPYSGNSNHAVVPGVLRAMDASDVSKPELWDSENTGNDNDHLGQFAKFCPPTIANGKVYVGTFQQETVGNDGIHRKNLGGDQPALAIYGLR